MDTLRLLVENNCGWAELSLTESNSSGKCIMIGKFSEADTVNKNKRKYPRSILTANVERLEESIKSRSCFGELDHPDTSVVSLKNASHLVTKLWWEGNNLMGQAEILGTPAGMIARRILEAGGRVGVSTRGVGSGTTNNEGILEISNFKLISFDLVGDASCHNAHFTKRVTNSSNESFDKSTMEEVRSPSKTLNNKMLLSYIECLFEQKENEIKELLK